MMAASRTQAPAPRTLWLTGNALRLHATLFVVASGCLAAGAFELSRALSGNRLSWVYAFEWPFFAGLSVVIWWRLLHEDGQADPAAAPKPPQAPQAWLVPAHVGDSAEDEQLRAWQDYLARLHAQDPPGGPPPARGSW